MRCSRSREARRLRAAADSLDTGRLRAYDFALDLPAGRRDLEARIAPSGPNEVTAIVRDFTDQRAAEAEVRARERGSSRQPTRTSPAGARPA